MKTESTPEPSAHPYAFPLTLDRSRAPLYRLLNHSCEDLRRIRLQPIGPAVMRVGAPATLAPGQAGEFAVYSATPARNARLQVSWERGRTNQQYLWSFVL